MPNVSSHLRTTLLAGAFAAIPIAVTVAIIAYVERLTREPLRGIGLGYPGLGIVVAVVAIYFTGLFVRSLVGKYFLRRLDRFLERVPVLRDLYKAWKQVSFTPGGGEGIYGKVVLVPDGRGEQYVLGFSSGECLSPECEVVAVFLPNAPNPVTGRVAFIRFRDVIVLTITSDEAFKMLISSGNYVPKEVALRMQERLTTTARAGLSSPGATVARA